MLDLFTVHVRLAGGRHSHLQHSAASAGQAVPAQASDPLCPATLQAGGLVAVKRCAASAGDAVLA